MTPEQHIGISLGPLKHWNDGLGEFSRQLCHTLARQAAQLRDERGWRLHFHLPQGFHGEFGDAVGYLDTHTSQRWLHLRSTRFALWHTLHQFIRLQPPLFTARRIETVHDLNFLYAKGPLRMMRYRARQRRRLARCEVAVAITRYVADEIARELAPLTTPIRVVHNGVSDLSAVAQESVAGLGDRPYLLHLSGMAPNKNVDALLQLAQAWPDQALVLAGATGKGTARTAARVSAMGLRNVQLLTNVSIGQKAWLYAHCRGFLFPSLAEGFGLPPVEAMHFGKSVFLSRLTSLPEIAGVAAHYFDDFDAAAMRLTIEAGLAEDTAPGRTEAIRAQACIFSWERCATGYISLYDRLLQAGSR